MTAAPIPKVRYWGDPVVRALRAPSRPDLPWDLPVDPPETVIYAGALPIGMSNYTVPAGAKFATAGGASSGTGAIGTPYQSAQYAINQAPSGSTIVLRGGVYHEELTAPSTKTLTLMAYPGEAVWFDGSSVYGSWTNNGNGTWTTNYTVTWDRTLDGLDLTRWKGGALRNLVDQVFVDNVALTQVADNTTPGPGQFSVNQSTDKLTIGVNPSGRTVRAVDMDNWLIASGVCNLYGIGVRRYSPQMVEFLNGLAYYGNLSGGSVIENCVFQESGMSGLNLTKTNITVRSCTIQDMKMSGGYASKGTGLVFEKNLIRRTNRNLWQAEPATASFKIVWGDNITIRQNWVEDAPVAYGIWADTSVTRINLYCNVVDGAGLQPMKNCCEIEGSDGGKYGGIQYFTNIVGNRFINGSQAGLLLYDSGWNRVWNNDLRVNAVGLQLWQDSRQNVGASASDGDPNVSPWHTVGNEVMNNQFAPPVVGTGLKLQFIAYDDGLKIYKGGDMWTRFAGNALVPAPPGSMTQQGALGGVRTSANTLAAFASLPSSVGGPFTDNLGTNYQGTGTAPDSIADPLPADLAAMIGVAAGTRLVGPNVDALPIPMPEGGPT